MGGARASPPGDSVLFHGQEALGELPVFETLLARFNHARCRLDEASQELDLAQYALPVRLLMARRPG
jgi:hypothetical protein